MVLSMIVGGGANGAPKSSRRYCESEIRNAKVMDCLSMLRPRGPTCCTVCKFRWSPASAGPLWGPKVWYCRRCWGSGAYRRPKCPAHDGDSEIRLPKVLDCLLQILKPRGQKCWTVCKFPWSPASAGPPGAPKCGTVGDVGGQTGCVGVRVCDT